MLTLEFLKWVPFLSNFVKSPAGSLIGALTPLIVFVVLRLRKQAKAWLSYAIDAFIIYPVGRWVIHVVSARATLRHYCQLQQSEEQIQYLLVPARNEMKLKVEDIFVPLQLESHSGVQNTYTHRDLLSLGNRIRVAGDPRSGKSSLIKRLFLDCCRTGIKSPTNSRLPCLVPLSGLSIPAKVKREKLGDWLYNRVREKATNSAVYKMGECFDSYAENEGLLVLLDGLDEVSTVNYQRVQWALDQLSEKLAGLSSKNTIIVTMRTQFYQETRDRSGSSLGQVVFVKPFSPSDIYDFLSKWPFRFSSGGVRTRIHGDLSDRPTLREMCSNPLILSMYVAEYHNSSPAVIPESRTEFYSRVTDELLINRRLRQTGPATAPTKLREQREHILGKVAYEHLMHIKEPSNSLNLQAVKRVIRSITNCDEAKAELLFREIAKETGLIAEERPGETIRFIHLTFCEFLAAREAINGQSTGWQSICKYTRSSSWKTKPARGQD